MCACWSLSHVWLFATPQTVAHQTPLSMKFSRQEYWSDLPCPSPGDLRDPGIEPASLVSPGLAGRFFTTDATWEAPGLIHLLSSFWNFVVVVSFLVIFGLIHVCIKKKRVKKNHLYCFDGVSRVSKGLSAFIEFNHFYLGMPWALFFILLFMMIFVKWGGLVCIGSWESNIVD